MNGATFVSNWSDLKDELVAAFSGPNATSEVAAQIRSLELNPGQMEQLRRILDAAIRDTMYTLLLGLDGAASLGKKQQRFQITAADGQVIESIEEEAWKCFHGSATS